MKVSMYRLIASLIVLLMCVAPSGAAAGGETAGPEPTPDRSSPKAIATSFVEWQFWQQSERTVPFLEASTRRSKAMVETMVSHLGGEAAERWRSRLEDIEGVLESFEEAKKKLSERTVRVTDVSTYRGLEQYREKGGGSEFPGAASKSVERIAEVTVEVTYTEIPRYRAGRETSSVDDLEFPDKTVRKKYVCRSGEGEDEGWVVVDGVE